MYKALILDYNRLVQYIHKAELATSKIPDLKE